MALLMERLYAQAEQRPEQAALVYREERVSYAELVDLVERLASSLAERGIKPGDAVGLALRDSPWFVASFHAITAMGAVVVPVNPAFKQAELEFCFQSADISAVISDARTVGVCERIAAGFEHEVQVIGGAGHGKAPTLDALFEGGSAERLAPRSPEEPFVYQFSSGSTGRPKRVPRTHGQCAAEADLYLDGYGIGPEDTVFSAIPLFHTYGMGSNIFGAAAGGATVVILEDPQPFLLKRHRALELIEQERATIFPGVPFNFRLMAEAPGDFDLSSLRLCYSAGTALPRGTFEGFGERFGILVRQLYGSTETGLMTVNTSADPVDTFESVGAPVGDVRIEIVDDDGEPVDPGRIGEVTVSSPAATSGYAEADSASLQAFRDGRFFTGDLGRLDEEGQLYLEGRKKLLIEVGGYKIDPIEVQDAIVAHPSVAEAIVVGVEGEVEGEEQVKAVVVLAEDCEESELLGFCRERLANFKVPRQVEFRDEIPKSPLGKVLRKYLV